MNDATQKGNSGEPENYMLVGNGKGWACQTTRDIVINHFWSQFPSLIAAKQVIMQAKYTEQYVH